MKTKIIFPVILFAMLFISSCSNDNASDQSAAGEEVAISIQIIGAKSQTKTMDANPTDADEYIADLIVFVAKADGSFDGVPKYFNGGQIASGVLPVIGATTKASQIFIVCNTGPLNTGIFSTATNMTQVARKAMAIDNVADPTIAVTPHHVWMSGYAPLVSSGTDTDGKIKKTANVTVEFIPAKIYVTVNNNMTNYSTTTGNTLIQGAMVVNGGAWTRFIKEGSGMENYKPLRSDITTANNVPFYYNGLDIDATSYADRPAPVNGFEDFTVKNIMNRAHVFEANESYEWSDLSSLAPGSQFYVCPNITQNQTYITVYGKYSDTGHAGVTATNHFWPVSFGGADGIFSDIQSGKKYLVTITLTGNADNGSGGTNDPTVPSVDANIIVNVQVQEWHVEAGTKIFN